MTDDRAGSLEWLWGIVQQRRRERPEGSYVVKLLDEGTDRVARKLGEEAAEVIIAAKNRSDEEVANEMADLWFHSLLVLQDAGLTPDDVFRTLAARHALARETGEPYASSASVYDAIYRAVYAARGTRFEDEAESVHRIIEQHGVKGGARLLDVACGTGAHIPVLRRHYDVEGLDGSAAMLTVARERNPGVELHLGDFANFDLGQQFDAVICLGSSIGYARTVERLRGALATFAAHLRPGGVVLVHAWITPENWQAGKTTKNVVDEPGLTIVRVSRSDRDGGVSISDEHYLIATPSEVQYVTERHELGLFTPQQYRDAFVNAGLSVTVDPTWGFGRGLYVGVRPAENACCVS